VSRSRHPVCQTICQSDIGPRSPTSPRFVGPCVPRRPSWSWSRGCGRWWRPSWRCGGHPADRGMAAAGRPGGLGDGSVGERRWPVLATAVLRLQLRRSLTWDQGREIAEHTRFTIDSRCPGLSLWRAQSLAARHQREHGRLRHTLGFKTPSQALASVALTPGTASVLQDPGSPPGRRPRDRHRR
jgi:hypothetical protein